MRIMTSVLGCCGYTRSHNEKVHAAFVIGTTEEIDEFFKKADVQDSMFSEKPSSDRFRLKVVGGEIAAYTLDSRWFDKYLPLPVEPKKLKRLLPRDARRYGVEWLVEGGASKPNDFAALVNTYTTVDGQQDFISIQGFGTSASLYKNQFKYITATHPGALFGTVFAYSNQPWVKGALKELREKYEVLVEYQWQNPRYEASSEGHCLTTVFFKEKQGE